MFSIKVCTIIAIGELDPLWGKHGHDNLVLLLLCDARKLLIRVSNIPRIIVNLLSSFGPCSLLESSPINLSYVFNSSLI